MKQIIDFYAPWCGPCKALAPVLEQIAEKNGIELTKINADEDTFDVELFGVQGLPTIIFLVDGVEVFRHSGAWTAQGIEEAVKEYLN